METLNTFLSHPSILDGSDRYLLQRAVVAILGMASSSRPCELLSLTMGDFTLDSKNR